jgi:hypothetical protein
VAHIKRAQENRNVCFRIHNTKYPWCSLDTYRTITPYFPTQGGGGVENEARALESKYEEGAVKQNMDFVTTYTTKSSQLDDRKRKYVGRLLFVKDY